MENLNTAFDEYTPLGTLQNTEYISKSKIFLFILPITVFLVVFPGTFLPGALHGNALGNATASYILGSLILSILTLRYFLMRKKGYKFSFVHMLNPLSAQSLLMSKEGLSRTKFILAPLLFILVWVAVIVLPHFLFNEQFALDAFTTFGAMLFIFCIAPGVGIAVVAAYKTKPGSTFFYINGQFCHKTNH